jgi:hypothetical protein
MAAAFEVVVADSLSVEVLVEVVWWVVVDVDVWVLDIVVEVMVEVDSMKIDSQSLVINVSVEVKWCFGS